MLHELITRLVGWAVAIFYRIERSGPPLPEGPVLIVANHPNALVDPLVVFRTGGRPSRPLAKAPLFEQALVGTVLRGLGGLPVYRRQDDPSLMHRNDRTFDAAVASLGRGEAVQIYPEGQSHSEPFLAPLRTGAARIAFQAEAEGDWGLGLVLQPVGLTYTRKHVFRGSVLASYGAPIQVADLRGAHEAGERDAVDRLTERIRTDLEALTLTLEQPGDRAVVELAERLWAREKGLGDPAEGGEMADRMPRLRRFAEGLRWLRAHDPESLRRLERAVVRYQRLRALYGAEEGDVPVRYPVVSVFGWLVRQVLTVLLGLPLGIVGMAVWAPPYLFTRVVTAAVDPKLDQIATYKLGTGMLAFPVWLALLSGTSGWLGGAASGVVVLLAAPFLGFVALAWREWGRRAVEDLRVWWRTARRRPDRHRLAVLRAELVADFDAVAADMRRRRGSTDQPAP